MHKSARTVWLKMVSKSASLRSAAGCSSRTVGNLFVGGYHEEEPWKQRNSSRADHWCHCVQSRYTPRRLSVLPLQRRSFVGQGLSPEALPPCSCRVERVVVENPLSRVGHTHTHTPVYNAKHPRPCRTPIHTKPAAIRDELRSGGSGLPPPPPSYSGGAQTRRSIVETEL